MLYHLMPWVGSGVLLIRYSRDQGETRPPVVHSFVAPGRFGEVFIDKEGVTLPLSETGYD